MNDENEFDLLRPCRQYFAPVVIKRKDIASFFISAIIISMLIIFLSMSRNDQIKSHLELRMEELIKRMDKSDQRIEKLEQFWKNIVN